MRSLREHADVVAGDSNRFGSQFCWQPGDISPVGNFWEETSHAMYGDSDNKAKDFISRPFAIRKEPISRYPDQAPFHGAELENQMAHRKSAYGPDHSWYRDTEDPTVENLSARHSSYKSDSRAYFNNKLRDSANHDPDGHITLNRVVKSATYNTPKEHFDQMDKITSHPTIKPLSLYRGFGNEMQRTMRTIPTGSEFIDHGYTGLSVHRSTAYHYGASGGYGTHVHDPIGAQHRTVAMVHVPPGTYGHLLDHPHDQESPLNDEGEFLLHRGTHFKVMGHTRAEKPLNAFGMPKAFNLHVVHLQVIGQHPKPIREPQRMEPKE